MIRNKHIALAWLAFVISMTGCATEAPILKRTQSGKPEVLLRNQKVADVRTKIVERCAMRGLMAEEQTSTIACSRTLDGHASVAAQLMVGNAYSTTPRQRFTFLITQRGTDTFVILMGSEVSTQMPGGQVRSMEAFNSNIINSIQEFLDGLEY
jgi:hypothetical protein